MMAIEIHIPGFADLRIQAVCSDFTGTLSHQGKLITGVKKRLKALLAHELEIHVVTSDTRKAAKRELAGIRLTLMDTIPPGRPHDVYKLQYVKELGINLKHIAVFGNGRNDRKWLKAVRDAGGLAVAVDVGEGCAMEAMTSAHVFVSGINDALDLLLDNKCVIATLRTK
jgi:soluble P-type ATPase